MIGIILWLSIEVIEMHSDHLCYIPGEIEEIACVRWVDRDSHEDVNAPCKRGRTPGTYATARGKARAQAKQG